MRESACALRWLTGMVERTSKTRHEKQTNMAKAKQARETLAAMHLHEPMMAIAATHIDIQRVPHRHWQPKVSGQLPVDCGRRAHCTRAGRVCSGRKIAECCPGRGHCGSQGRWSRRGCCAAAQHCSDEHLLHLKRFPGKEWDIPQKLRTKGRSYYKRKRSDKEGEG